MVGINRVIVVGRLGADPEIRRTKSGDAIATVSLATSDIWRDKQTGDRKEKTEWHRISVFGKAAEIVEQYMSKGDEAGFEGKLQTRKWQDKDGNDRYITEVFVSGFDGKVYLMGGGKSRNQNDDRGYRSPGNNGGSGGQPSGGSNMDDDIPFVMEWR